MIEVRGIMAVARIPFNEPAATASYIVSKSITGALHFVPMSGNAGDERGTHIPVLTERQMVIDRIVEDNIDVWRELAKH
jgi:hypothetical protein